jgi:hypothetical protein
MQGGPAAQTEDLPRLLGRQRPQDSSRPTRPGARVALCEHAYDIVMPVHAADARTRSPCAALLPTRGWFTWGRYGSFGAADSLDPSSAFGRTRPDSALAPGWDLCREGCRSRLRRSQLSR